jgi:hypothetical protein
MKAKEYFGMAVAMAMMSESIMNDNSEKPREFIPREEKDPKLPKGCKHYWFDKNGCYPNQIGINNGEVVFKCIARTEKKAIEKFNTFIRSNQAER